MHWATIWESIADTVPDAPAVTNGDVTRTWADYDDRYEAAGLVPPKNHRPVTEDSMVYDDDGQRVGYATSAMYSPILQRHIALARVRPEHAKRGTRLYLEFTIDHAYEKIAADVTELPFFDPPRKTGNP